MASTFHEAAQLAREARVGADGRLETARLLAVCRLVLPVVDKLGAGFSLVRSDVGGNIERLAAAAARDPAHAADVFRLVADEVAAGGHTASDSATKGLLWLKRAMEFVTALLRRLGEDEAASLSAAASEVYYETLQRYHGWLVTGTFAVALKLVPSRETFVERLAAGEAAAGGDALARGMAEFCAEFGAVLADVHAFLEGRGLDDPAKV